MSDKAIFLATIPNIQSAIKVAGDGGFRIQLDIPQSEEVNALPVLMMRERVLRVTVEPHGDNETGGTVSRTTAKRRV